MRSLVLVLLLGFLSAAFTAETEYLKKLEDAIAKVPQQPKEDNQKTTRDYNNELGITFNCDVAKYRKKQKATSVHELGPADIDVISTVGDSITAGNGLAASNLVDVLSQNRGESWSIGGDEDLDTVITFTNAIRKYNPDVKGYSIGKSGTGNARSWLNRAVPGAVASNIPNQVIDLIEKLQTDERIDYENDWKVLTLLIGGNDLCSYCRDRDRYSPENFEKHIKDALDRLHAEVPRMLVNLVPLFDVTNLDDISTGLVCDGMQRSLCGCAFGDTKPEMRPTQVAYAERLRGLATSGEYDTRDDFTVVIQPSLMDITDPPTDPDTGEPDPSWFSYDCFHPDRKTHQVMALNLWNTMFIPVPDKPNVPPSDTMDLTFTCPSAENPYFATNLNSRLRSYPVPVPFRVIEDHEPEKSNINIIAILGGVLGACALAALAMGMALFMRKRTGRPGQKEVEMQNVGTVNPACGEA